MKKYTLELLNDYQKFTEGVTKKIELVTNIGENNCQKVAEFLLRAQDDFIKEVYDEIKTEYGVTSPDDICDEIEREKTFAVIDTCCEIFDRLWITFNK